MNLKSLLDKGVAFLNDAENASLNAEILLAYTVGVEREYILAHDEEDVLPELEVLYFAYLKRLAQGEPVAYIMKEKEFFGLHFFVDKRVLIPRPETEQIVEIALEYLRNNLSLKKNVRILDVGTGSGNIAISMAKTLEDEAVSGVEILALELDHDALEVARYNTTQYDLGHLINLAQSDLLEVIDEGEEFDLILANLPYVAKDSYVSQSTLKFEPHKALFADEVGLGLYKKMFHQLVERRMNFDLLVGEFGFGQRKSVEELLGKYFVQKNCEIKKDLAGIDRIFVVTA